MHSNILLFECNKTKGKEMDIEGLSVEGNYLFIIGSHSSKRQLVEENRKYKKNRKNFLNAQIKDERIRDWLYRLKINATGKEVSRKKISLRNSIKNDPVLKTFSHIPSKENGIDIEGISAKKDWLHLGFRGPVLRGNYVPLIRLKFDDPKGSYDLLYIELKGRGIRDMARISDGFLILAGPVGSGPASYQLYHWNGKDMIAGNDRKAEDRGQLRLLDEITPPQKGKREGVGALQDT